VSPLEDATELRREEWLDRSPPLWNKYVFTGDYLKSVDFVVTNEGSPKGYSKVVVSYLRCEVFKRT
jgi:hypothetical protein